MHDIFSAWDASLPLAAGQAIDAGDPYRAVCALRRRDPPGCLRPGHARQLRRPAVAAVSVPERRRRHLRGWLRTRGPTPATLRRLAHCYFEVGRFGKAAEVMRVALSRMARPDAATTNTLAWTLERDHQTDEARHYAEAAHAARPVVRPGSAAARAFGQAGGRHGTGGQASHGPTSSTVPERVRLGFAVRAGGGAATGSASTTRRGPRFARRSRSLRPRRPITCATRTSFAAGNGSSLPIRHAGRPAALAPGRRLVDASPSGSRFLTGFPRSGTTLLEQIIASHARHHRHRRERDSDQPIHRAAVWKADDAMSAIIELRSFDTPQLVAGRETFYELTRKLPRPGNRRAAVDREEPLAHGRSGAARCDCSRKRRC